MNRNLVLFTTLFLFILVVAFYEGVEDWILIAIIGLGVNGINAILATDR